MSGPTGKDHARINLGIWGDDDFRDLTPAEQHLYFALWTSPNLTYCGAGDWHPGRLANLAGDWTRHDVEQAAAGLSRRLFLLIDTDTDEFLLRSWIKHDGLWRTPNMAVSVANARAALSSRNLRGVVVHEVLKIQALHEDSGSWKRDAVVSMLGQNAIDPATLEPFNPGPNPGPKGGSNPTANPGSNPTAKGWPGNRPNPGPTPTPSTLLSSYSNGDYVSRDVTTGAHEDSRPLDRCATHAGMDIVPPCGACAEARKAGEVWDRRAKRDRIVAERQERETRADVERDAIARCDLCDGRGYAGGRVCDHDPGVADRASRGVDACRRAIGGQA